MKILKRVLLFIVIIILIAISYFIATGYKMYKDKMDEKSLEDRIADLRAEESFTPILELPKDYLNAVIAIEDHRFYNHFGIDILATSRAMLNNIVSFKMKGGGSSITQQVAKNLCFTQEKTLTRKVAELFVVFRLEKDFEKDEILEIYINNMYFGNGYYNIHDAAEGYYDKKPADLNLFEASLLAGVPNAPSVYAPTVNLELAEQRQSQVLDAMVKYKYLSQEAANKIKDMQETRSK